MKAWKQLQLFAEGGEGAAPAAEGNPSKGDTLRNLGVPEDRVQKHINRKEKRPWRKKLLPPLQQKQQTVQAVAEVPDAPQTPQPAVPVEQGIRNHYDSLHRQGQALQSRYKDFDLNRELDNPVFLKLTGPQVGLSVEDAYMAVHHRELMEAVARGARQEVTNSIRAGAARPAEHGINASAPGVVTFDYKNATRSQREAFKKQIFEAAARGEKIYPR